MRDRRPRPWMLTPVSAALMAALVLSTAPEAEAARYVDEASFGLHVPLIATGADPDVDYGSVRLWDSGVAWGQVEQRRGRFWWNGLDAAVAAADAQGVQILYVLGSTPTWAASDRRAGTYPNRGAASRPKDLDDWRRWVTAVVRRHGDSIDAYQIWNEANLRTFWQGTPAQMARLTLIAERIIHRLDPTATVVAASSTVRLTSAFTRFFPRYLKQLRKRGWPVDAFAIHTYGPSTATPALREDYIRLARRELRDARAPARPLWDTEVNYGIAGPGTAHPDRDIRGARAASYVAQTYLDSIRLRVGRTFWYSWSARSDLLGITMNRGTPAAKALRSVVRWTVQARATCRSAPVNSCAMDRGGLRTEIAWVSSGPARPYVVPTGARRMCTALNDCRSVRPGSTVTVGRMPVRFEP